MCALQQAIRVRNKRQLKILVEMKTDVNKTDHTGRTALITVTELQTGEQNKAVQMATILLKHGANVALKDRHGINALCHACANEQEELVRTFLHEKRVNLNDIDLEGNTCLHHAVKGGSYNIVRTIAHEMMEYRLCFDTLNINGETPLILAAKLKRMDLCGILEECSPASKFVRDAKHFKTAEEWKRTRTISVAEAFCKKFPTEITRFKDCVDVNGSRDSLTSFQLSKGKRKKQTKKRHSGPSLASTLPDIFSLYDGRKSRLKIKRGEST